jgi:hypothetical protein
MELDPRWFMQNLPVFEAALQGIPWFLNLGKPHPRDSEVRRIRSWDEWGGPERGYGDWFGRYPAVVRERIEAEHSDRQAELDAVWARIEGFVFQAACGNVPGAGEGDPWHGPTACVSQAGYTAALVGWHLLLGRDLPAPSAAEWTWLASGHWPCDYAEPPPGYGDESQIDIPAGKLVVF